MTTPNPEQLKLGIAGLFSRAAPQYAHYAHRTTRENPVILLRPDPATARVGHQSTVWPGTGPGLGEAGLRGDIQPGLFPAYQPTAQREGETAMSLEANKDLVRRFLAEVFGTGNVEAVGDFMVPNSFLYGFMRKFVAERAIGIPDAKIQIEEIFGEGDKVAVSASSSGTNSGPLLGHPPTHKEVALKLLWIFTVRDGRVISMQFASDMAQQLWVPGPT